MHSAEGWEELLLHEIERQQKLDNEAVTSAAPLETNSVRLIAFGVAGDLWATLIVVVGSAVTTVRDCQPDS